MPEIRGTWIASTGHKRHYHFVRGDIADRALVRQALEEHAPAAIVHFAAESHVDRSIRGPEDFIHTNINGTFALLEETRAYWAGLAGEERDRFRFLHVSTDEVFGSLGPNDPPFSETTRVCAKQPLRRVESCFRSPGSCLSPHLRLADSDDQLLQQLRPFQFPEKLIPLMILNARDGKALPVYGDGKNVRDWLYVEDHCEAIAAVLRPASPGRRITLADGTKSRISKSSR